MADQNSFGIAGLLGWPVAHSRSPVIHNHWLAQHGIPGRYVLFAVPPEKLETAVRGIATLGLRGCNVTTPHKQAIFPLLDRVDDLARKIGAVNTVVVEKNGTLTGFNNDGNGFIQSLRDADPKWRPDSGPIVVLGAGGASRAVVASLAAQGAKEIRLTNRTLDKAKEIADAVGPVVKVLPWDEREDALEGVAMLANATSLGMTGKPPLEISLDRLPKSAVVGDLIYIPPETPLLAAARARGNITVNGLGLLLNQARPAFNAWFGVMPEITPALRQAIAATFQYVMVDVSIFDEPKIDCHVHVLDPVRFPYRADTHYAPAGQEIGTAAQLAQVMDAYGTRHALLVGPNSGYGLDNACMLDTIARGAGRYKGIAVVANDATRDELRALSRGGVVGVAWNVTHYGIDYYRDAKPLLHKLAELGMLVDIQVEHSQLIEMMPMLADSGVRMLVDHCGRPTVESGLHQPGFQALLNLGATKRAYIKLSGFSKFSHTQAPYDDARPYVSALVDAFTLEHCLWASDWPHLRAHARLDYGVLLRTAVTMFPNPADRRMLMWDTPRKLFAFVDRASSS